MKPYSDNIIFLDTEVSSLDPYKGEILSIGIVKQNGEELYLELDFIGEVDPWVEENILPTLKKSKISREEVVKQIKQFIGDSKPYVVSFINQFDTIYLYKLFGIENHPFYWIPVDFASILFGLGINPEDYSLEKEKFYKKFKVNLKKYKKHHALDDAKLLREVYLKFSKQKI